MSDSGIKVIGLAQIQKKLAKLPPATAQVLKATLKGQVENLVEAMKANAPYDPDNADQQHLKDSVHAYENPKRVIGYIILADAKDADGKFIGSNIEAGHRAVNGDHVVGRPFFFPTYRAFKTPIRRALGKAARQAIREYWGK